MIENDIQATQTEMTLVRLKHIRNEGNQHILSLDNDIEDKEKELEWYYKRKKHTK